MKRCYIALVVFLALVFTLTISSPAQTPPRVTPMTPDVVDKYEQTLPSADYIRREVMIPMRDGVKLFTIVTMKKGVTKAPILLSRTPYNASGSAGRNSSQRRQLPLRAQRRRARGRLRPRNAYEPRYQRALRGPAAVSTWKRRARLRRRGRARAPRRPRAASG